jgi:hypothetical protein
MSDEPTKSNWTLQREQQEKIKVMEYWWNWVDSGRSFEELKIMLDIHAAAGGLSERLCEVSREALELIRKALEAGLNRHEAITFLRERTKP